MIGLGGSPRYENINLTLAWAQARYPNEQGIRDTGEM